MKTVLVVGASGATGQHVVKQLLNQGHNVTAIVRRNDALPPAISLHQHYNQVVANISDLNSAKLAQHLTGCQAVVCCLGHNLSFRGMFGAPRKLVRDTVINLQQAAILNKQPIKFVLMSSSGCCNYQALEKPPFSQRLVVSLLRYLLPPHADNEQAMQALSSIDNESAQYVEWVIVRPDSLIDADDVSEYKAVESPVRNVIFNAGQVSRINVAQFMVNLLLDNQSWAKWHGKMPVLYNASMVAP